MSTALKADNPNNDQQLNALMKAHTDVTGAQLVEVVTASNSHGGVVWVNVNGINLLRVCNVQQLTINGEGEVK